MDKVNTGTAPAVFLPKFQKPAHSYPTNFSKLNYVKPTSQLSRLNYRISVRGQSLWNGFFTENRKSNTYHFLKVK